MGRSYGNPIDRPMWSLFPVWLLYGTAIAYGVWWLAHEVEDLNAWYAARIFMGMI